MTRVSVVVPVKDGERYLEELLAALAREGADEVLVIDSGSTDRSLEIVRAAAGDGVELLEIPPHEFGHGRTRNLGCERTSGDLIAFLTQDATPVPGWLDGVRAGFALDERVGAIFGPHLPRADTSPMIARELERHFAGLAGDDGGPAVHGPGDEPFLSNVNAAYRRDVWEQIRFRDVPYSEDQAFGRDLLAAGWLKAYHPDAAVLHAHDYGAVEFMRRYFDEYRGLRVTAGHVEAFQPVGALRTVRAETAADLRWMRAQGMPAGERARWAARATVHHGGRRVFSALGSRADRLPAGVRSRISLEGRDDGAATLAATGDPAGLAGAPPVPPPHGRAIPAQRAADDYADAAHVLRDGPAPLIDPIPGMAERERLRLALVVPPWRRGSGGHNTLFQLLSRLERRGHVCSVWVVDEHGETDNRWPAVLRDEIREWFAPFEGPVYKGFDDWHGADVVMATGWQTVHPALLLDNARARAYIVNDHEPEFFPTSTEYRLAEDTYRHDMHCIAASPWLRDLVAERYGASADAFQLGVDHAIYAPRADVARGRDTVVYYARHSTDRRAVPVGLMALAELHRRRPQTRIVLFGTDRPPLTSFPYEHLDVLGPGQLAALYNEATVGLCLSLTNFSLMPKEMLACGLPCVELAGVSAESIFGADGPLELAPLEPVALAQAIERLLDDPAEWERRSRAGVDFVATHTWDVATDEVEAGLRHALREREALLAAAP